jgi:hypothetical protein
MKKVLLGIVAGLALGAGVTAWWSRRPTAAITPAAVSPGPPTAASAAGPLQITPADQAKAGFLIAAPIVVELQPETKAYGRVLDPTPLVNLLTDVATAQAALTASQKEFNRLQKLHAEDDNVSAQALEAAEAALKRDRAQATSAHARLVAAWGPALASRSDLRALVQSFVDQRAAVARLDVPPEEASLPPSAVRCQPVVGGAASRAAEMLGAAPTADPQVQGAAWLVLLREQPPPAGTALIGYLAHEGSAQKALTVPRTAIVYHEGSAWLYLLGVKDTFERRRIELGRALPDSFVVTAGVAENDRVLTTGAQQLLSNELQAAGGGE